jgi:hemerythrin
MTIVWTDDLNIGIDVIDNQHRQLVDYINALEGVDEHDLSAVSSVLDNLIDYTISHFSYEENLQKEAGYMFALPHKQIHEEFIKQVSLYKYRHNKGELISSELYKMLCIWLKHHIQHDDRDYVDQYLRKFGKNPHDKN